MYKFGDSRVYKLLCEISVMSPSLHNIYVSCLTWVSICKFIEKVETRGMKGQGRKGNANCSHSP